MPSSPVSIPMAKNNNNKGVPKKEDNLEAKIAKVSRMPTMKKA